MALYITYCMLPISALVLSVLDIGYTYTVYSLPSPCVLPLHAAYRISYISSELQISQILSAVRTQDEYHQQAPLDAHGSETFRQGGLDLQGVISLESDSPASSGNTIHPRCLDLPKFQRLLSLYSLKVEIVRTTYQILKIAPVRIARRMYCSAQCGGALYGIWGVMRRCCAIWNMG